MKALASTLILFYLAGCSPEESSREASTDTGLSYKMMHTEEPFNPENDNDTIGIIYSDLLDAYYLSPASDTTTLQQLIDYGEALAFLNTGFLALSGQGAYVPIDGQDVQPYLIVDPASFDDLLSPAYGEAAREFLINIAAELGNLKNKDAPYQEVYNYLVDAEAAIIDDPALIGQERNALLTTTSIIRNALYHDKKRKRRDRDWEWMTSNIAATANAAMESPQQAIIMSFATDVYYD